MGAIFLYEKTLNDLGLSITEAINVFLNQVILHDGIPFEICNVILPYIKYFVTLF